MNTPLAGLDPEASAVANAVVDHLAATGHWPHYRTIERPLVKRFNVEPVLRRLNPDLDTWNLLHSDTSEVRLGPIILIQCDNIENALAPLVKAFPVVIDRYVNADKPMIRHTDFLAAGFTQDEVNRVGILIQSVGKFTMSGGSSPGAWYWDLAPHALELKQLKSAADYLRWWNAREGTWDRNRKRAERKAKLKKVAGETWFRAAVASLVVGALLAIFSRWIGGNT